MAIARGACPNCGAPIEFRAGTSAAQVCANCKFVVVRTDRDFRAMGRVADVTFNDASLSPGDTGSFRGRHFSVEGRLVLQHPAGGTWEEYYAVFDGRDPSWISEAQGRWQVVGAVNVPAPPIQELQPQTQITLGTFGVFVVQESNRGRFLSAEGELPFVAAPGTERIFVDLSGPNGAWASIDYGDGTIAPQVFVGVQTTLAEFQLKRHAGVTSATEVKTSAITCPNCGGQLPILSPGTERIACKYCNAISDVKEHQVVARQEKARDVPSIELGAKGVLRVADVTGLRDVEWTVLGYVERSNGEIYGSDDWFGWQEYLLSNDQHGYRWLVFDEGDFSLVAPIAAGDVDTRRDDVFVVIRDVHYKTRNRNPAVVDYVLGEFYWKVQVGERVDATDYTSGNIVVSAERSPEEINWSMGTTISDSAVSEAFGYAAKESVYGDNSEQKAASRKAVLTIVAFILILGFVIISAALSDSSGSGGVRGVGIGGGFGGK